MESVMEGNLMIHQIIAKMNKRNFSVGSTHMVEVTHINDPKSFYVRLAFLSEDVSLFEGRGDLIDEDSIKIRKHVIYKSKALNKYVRGEIVAVHPDRISPTCEMFAIDYGCREQYIQFDRIYLPEFKIKCPPLAIHCQLYLCEPKGDVFNKDAIDAMKLFVGEHTAKMTIRFQILNKFVIELNTLHCPDDVSTMLGLLHFTTFTQSANVPNRFDNDASSSNVVTYKCKNIKVGQKLCVRVLSGESISNFYVAELNDFKTYLRDGCQFTEYCKYQKLQDVAASIDGRCCGVRVGQPPKYERAIVKQVTKPDAKALVKLVDWGKEVEVNFGDIKCTTSEVYTNHPAIAIYCSSTEDQVWSNGLNKILYPGFQFIIDIVELGNGIDVPHKVNISPFLMR